MFGNIAHMFCVKQEISKTATTSKEPKKICATKKPHTLENNEEWVRKLQQFEKLSVILPDNCEDNSMFNQIIIVKLNVSLESIVMAMQHSKIDKKLDDILIKINQSY